MEAKETRHSVARDVAEEAKKSGVKRLLLTHFSPRYADTRMLLEEAKAEFKETLAAEDGMRLEV
jgi:ribonuclease Z